MTSPTIRQHENMSDGSVKPETQKHQQMNSGIYEPVNTQLVYDNQRHYENAAFDNQNKTVNVYEILQTRTDDHAYADLENN